MRPHPTEIFKDLRAYPFFASFADNLLLQIATMASVKQFKEGEDILLQGQENDCIYFLKSGDMRVIVDEEPVATLSKRGEVLGEMSVFSGKKVSATVRAANTVELYVINPNEFNHTLPKDRDKFLFLMYKIYSVVVAERLVATNDKAKKFEIANRELQDAKKKVEDINKNLELLVNERTKELREKATELESSRSQLEQQNAALVAGFKKVSDLAQSRDRALEKIRSLANDQLQPLQKSLMQLHVQSSSTGKELVIRTLSRLDEVFESLQPLTELYQSEKAIQSKSVLIIDPDRKQQMIAKMALGGTGVRLDLAQDASEAQTHLAQKSYDLVLCEISQNSAVTYALSQNFEGEIVLMTSNEIQTYLEQLKDLAFVGHVISRDKEDRTFTIKSIHTTVSKILNNDFFGLEKYLSWGTEVFETKVNQSGQRLEAIMQMKEQLQNFGIRNSILDRVHTVAEEMLMNAIYDAPIDEDGKSLFNHLPRTVEVNLSEDQVCSLRYACDGNFLAISVTDPFGGLPKETIIRYLDSCYQGNAGIFNEQKGGAGRGLHLIIENSDLTVFNVKKLIRTEVICLFNLDSTQRKNIEHPSFHYFFS